MLKSKTHKLLTALTLAAVIYTAYLLLAVQDTPFSLSYPIAEPINHVKKLLQEGKESYINHCRHQRTVFTNENDNPDVCIIVTSVYRDLQWSDDQYVCSLVGSLYSRMSADDISRVHLYVLNVNDPPDTHIAMHTLQNCVTVLHDGSDAKNLSWFKKENHDYSKALKFCSSKAPYTLVLEDDVVLHPFIGFRSLWKSLRVLGDRSDWLYLRLFNAEAFMGYQIWYLIELIGSSLSISAALLLVPLVLFKRFRSSTLLLYVWLFVVLTLLIIGRQSVVGVFLQHGLKKEESYSCCTQALLYRSEYANQLADYIKTNSISSDTPTDTLVDEFKEKRRLKSFTVYPSIFQHVGLYTSKDGTLHQPLVYSASFMRSYNKDE